MHCFIKYFLCRHIRESTKPNSASPLDVIFPKIGIEIINLDAKKCFDSSDHPIINFKDSFEIDELWNERFFQSFNYKNTKFQSVTTPGSPI